MWKGLRPEHLGKLKQVLGEDVSPVIERARKIDESDSFVLGFLHGYYLKPFVDEVARRSEAVVGVGRDSVPLLIMSSWKGKPVAYVGISRGSAVHRALVHAFPLHDLKTGISEEILTRKLRKSREAKPFVDAAERVANRLISRGLKQVAVVDMGMRGTHSLPLKALLKEHGLEVLSALAFAHEDYRDLHDIVGYTMPATVSASISSIQESIPHPVSPFLTPRKLQRPGKKYKEDVHLWLKYLEGLARGWEARR